jgi:DnaK suppressor protein
MVVITAALKYLEAKDFQWILLSVQIIFYRKIGNTIMEEKDLEFFRHLLIQWMEELLDHADETVEGLLDSQEILADPLDRATVESDRIWTLRIRDRESKLIKKIRQSLEDIENGEYGICEDCGEDISIERLKARPVTSLCIGCKTKRESLEKLTGT